MSHGGPSGQTAPPQGRWCSAGRLHVCCRTGEHPASCASAPAGRSETPVTSDKCSYKRGLITCALKSCSSRLRDGVRSLWDTNLVAVAQGAVALPAVGTGAAQARGGLRGGGLGAHRLALGLTTDELRLRWRTLPHLPQTRGDARHHGNASTTDIRWNRCRWNSRRLKTWDMWKQRIERIEIFLYLAFLFFVFNTKIPCKMANCCYLINKIINFSQRSTLRLKISLTRKSWPTGSS